jgi:imidazolonepropionase-like amidohydrolase
MLTAIRIVEVQSDLTLGTPPRVRSRYPRQRDPVTAGPILFSRSKYELKEMTPKNPGLMSAAGVKVAIQTDEMSAVKYLSINAALAVREGMPEEEALKAITLHPAQIIGVADRVGSLEVGKDADIVVFNWHPLDYRSVVELVLVDGQVAYRRETLEA